VNTNKIQTNQLLQKLKESFQEGLDSIEENPFLKDVIQFPIMSPNNDLIELPFQVVKN
jgi:hypothetical protein